ncbi:uncharacterized protein EDB91DRAFT_17179 [Suillus paluster]|uniref:uncharacterized protein n=1 Tax=Suillus paluster TaxID=48578 RepID=UPI001B884B24|nr:uncharacterized protein EDB91DRAFT_17179 [Suillus paluster]KAG1756465.1 hypothetical protein EDB91DRAFT_17179 [Suillus paluster]
MSASFLKRLTDYHTNKRPRTTQFQPSTTDSRDMTFFPILSSTSSQYLYAPLAPSRKRSQMLNPKRDDVDDFLSSDLELSFASTMSLNSPPRDTMSLAQDHDVPMDISPAPRPVQKENDTMNRPTTRPRASTSAARIFGQDMSNGTLSNDSVSAKTGSQANSKRTQRSALPMEWMAASKPLRASKTLDGNMFAPPPDVSISLASDDAMDVDSDLLPSPPLSAAPTVTEFNNLFYGVMTSSCLDTPGGPQAKKRRSLSPETVSRVEHDPSSSPPPSSPSQHKLDRMANFAKPALQGLGAPPNASKRARRLAFSALVQPGVPSPQSAYPVLDSETSPAGMSALELPPSRRAFSMVPSTVVDHLSDEGSSFDGPDMSSPAQAYAKRQQFKAIRRRDGTEDFRPLTGASAMVQRDISESPSAKFMAAGLPGFGDNETLGKILPCHRVREDGLMRVVPKTLDDLLDGVYDSRIANFHVIDCRFDYEYDGGHIPGAVNINTTTGVEEFLLGVQKPKPSVSGDSQRKTILVFHCEFSAKRAPTFAKHLRAKDRAMNNHMYPRIHYPEVYILEGGYCEYYKQCASRCQPRGYVTMDDPNYALSRKEDLDQFRKGKFGRTKSYAYGDLALKVAGMTAQPPKRNTAPAGAPQLFAAANAARTRRHGLSTVAEIGNITQTDDEDTDIGDSPCPPPNKGTMLLSKAKRLGRITVARADTFDAARMASY